ncbi:hypothetical protein [Burkholderia sp. AW49-1]
MTVIVAAGQRWLDWTEFCLSKSVMWGSLGQQGEAGWRQFEKRNVFSFQSVPEN